MKLQKIKSIGKYVLILAFVALLVLGFLAAWGPLVGNVFSTINSCLGCVTDPPTSPLPAMSEVAFIPTMTVTPILTGTPFYSNSATPTQTEIGIPPNSATAMPTSAIPPNATQTLLAAFSEVNSQFENLLNSSIAFNKPKQMQKGQTANVELILNPSMSESALATKLVEQAGLVTSTADPNLLIESNGASVTVETSRIDITPRMKAVLLSDDPDAFVIVAMHDNPEQVISSVDTTTWHWSVTAKKEGSQTLELVMYQLVKFDGKDFWPEVQTYKASIVVEVTPLDQLKSLDWKWIAGFLVTLIGAVLGVLTWLGSKGRNAASPSGVRADGKQQAYPGAYENKVFVSYAWGGESASLVDKLEQSFATRGLSIVRDKKDLDYKGSIEEFEQRIGGGQCVVLVISDKYLRSEHCMYELLEVDENHNLRDRIFPIVLADARIHTAVQRLIYVKYWDKQIDKLNEAIKGVGVMTNLAASMSDLDRYARIRSSFDHLSDLLSDMNALTPEQHAAHDFSTLIDAVRRSMTGA